MNDRRADALFAVVGWLNSGATIAAIKFNLSFTELLTILFVTIPVGVWSWLRCIDAIKERLKKNDRPRTPADSGQEVG